MKPNLDTAQPNILLLTVDSVRADHVGWHGYSRNTTPFLDSLVRKSIDFELAYAPSVHTRESIPSILTGRYPEDAVSFTYRIQDTTLAEELQHAGYATGAFLSSPFFTKEFGYESGFDRFDSNYSQRTAPMFAEYLSEIVRNRHYRDGYSLNKAIGNFLQQQAAPRFIWGHYMDVHGPYNRFDETTFGEAVDERQLQILFRRAKYLPSTVSQQERQLLIDHYDNEIRYFDGVMCDLFKRLKSGGHLQNSLIFVVADHGESFGEHGLYEHKRHLGRELLRVPLFIHGCVDSATVSEPVSTVDIFQTIANVVGINLERDGASLFAERRTSPIRASCLNYFRRQKTTLSCD